MMGGLKVRARRSSGSRGHGKLPRPRTHAPHACVRACVRACMFRGLLCLPLTDGAAMVRERGKGGGALCKAFGSGEEAAWGKRGRGG